MNEPLIDIQQITYAYPPTPVGAKFSSLPNKSENAPQRLARDTENVVGAKFIFLSSCLSEASAGARWQDELGAAPAPPADPQAENRFAHQQKHNNSHSQINSVNSIIAPSHAPAPPRETAKPAQTKPALRNVTLQIQHGEYVVLLGHNGSGKSTLARHCNGLLVPDEGNAVIAGLNTRDKGQQRAIRDTIGMIFQNPDNQIIATVVEDDVAWALTVRGFPANVIYERVEQSLTAVGIADLRKRSPQTLSGGQRQRLAIAGVLALRPKCIIADEATSMLDPLSRQEIVALLHQLHQEYGLTIIHVTHLLDEIALAQRVVVMEQGEVVMQGTPTDLFADLSRLRALKLSIPEPIELAARLRRAGMPIARDAITLEAIVRELTH